MNDTKQRTFLIGQALHGYEGGHTLLASSETLSHTTESVLFMLSDLSGGQIVPGFEEYLTGYPLQDMAAYAFAKTWYAPEMERPGCVWTHTLIVRATDLAVIDYPLLMQMFLRPHKNGKWSHYEKKLTVDIDSSEHYTPGGEFLPSKCEIEVLYAVYGRPEAPVFLPAESSREYEGLILRLWSQQWPRLRRAFRFCTGSLESRSSEGHPFDLQVIPFAITPSVQRELPSAVFVGKTQEIILDHVDNASWLNTASQDLRSPNMEVRRFVREYGADVAPKRSSYTKMLRTFDLISRARSQDISFPELVEGLLSIFPSGTEATKLKLAVLRPFPPDAPGLQLPVTNQERLLELATVPNDSALPKRMSDVDEWAQSLLRREEAETFKFIQALVYAPHINSVGQQLLDSIAANVLPEQLRLIGVAPSVSMLLVTRNPGLAGNPTIWKLLASRGHELLDLLKSCNLTQEDWTRIIRATVESSVPNVAASLIKIVGASALRTVLDWAMERGSMTEVGQDWRDEFGSQSATVAGWLRHFGQPPILILMDLTSDLNPLDPAVLSLGADVWLSVADRSKSLPTRSNTFLLVLACQNPAGTPFEIVSRVFEQVHRAAWDDALGYQSWRLLRDVLPVLGSSKDWDVCERLRRMLVSRFLASGWPTAAFLRALENPETLERTLQYLTGQRDLRSFCKRLVDDVEEGRVALSSNQSTVFDSYWKKLRRS